MKLSLGDPSLYCILALIIALCLLTTPVLATIIPSVQTSYDANGQTAPFGEEILVKLTIDPGLSGLTNLKIILQNDQAFIDLNSVERTIVSVAQSSTPVIIKPEGNTFSVDQLKPGEKITLTFIAYPKTIQTGTINAGNAQIEYIQLGQSLSETVRIPAIMTSSAWFILQNKNQDSIVIWLAILVTAIIILILFFVYRQKKMQKKFKDRLTSLQTTSQNIQDPIQASKLEELKTLQEQFNNQLKVLLEMAGTKNQSKKTEEEKPSGDITL
jgi:hypothetical protein